MSRPRREKKKRMHAPGVDSSIFCDTFIRVKIVWDEPKRLSNLDKHGMDFADLTMEYFATATIFPARRDRFLAVGPVGRLFVTVIFTKLGSEAISVVSLRPASPKERKLL